jgi:hypothetical protein
MVVEKHLTTGPLAITNLQHFNTLDKGTERAVITLRNGATSLRKLPPKMAPAAPPAVKKLKLVRVSDPDRATENGKEATARLAGTTPTGWRTAKSSDPCPCRIAFH